MVEVDLALSVEYSPGLFRVVDLLGVEIISATENPHSKSSIPPFSFDRSALYLLHLKRVFEEHYRKDILDLQDEVQDAACDALSGSLHEEACESRVRP